MSAGLAQALMAVIVLLAGAPATAAVFVGSELTDLKPEQKVVVAQPQPVQLLFQFQTKGSPNLQATKQVREDVVRAVKDSGLFSQVSDGPTANGAILNIVIDDVVTPEDTRAAATKGAITGATFFVAGSNIREHYTCTIDYVPGPTAPKLTRTAQHSVVVQMGLINSTPTDAVKVEGGIKGAVSVMVRQIVSNPLNAIAADPGFAPTAAAPAPTATPEPQPAATPAAPEAQPAPPAAPDAPKPQAAVAQP